MTSSRAFSSRRDPPVTPAEADVARELAHERVELVLQIKRAIMIATRFRDSDLVAECLDPLIEKPFDVGTLRGLIHGLVR